MAAGEERIGIGRRCPHCGVRADTLGSTCPACGRPYAPRGGLLDRVPVSGEVFDNPYGMRLLVVGWFALIAAAIWLIVTHPVAGIPLLALAFVVLVAAIGVANALNDRGR
jgi:hypothetical protein